GPLTSGAKQTLIEAGIPSEQIDIFEVPGSYELPQAANWLAQVGRYDAIICIGCVIKGETSHNEYINHTVASKLADIALSYSLPVIFGVLTPNNYEQALERAGGKFGNKGSEAAVAALEMLDLQASLPIEVE
ncbi:MAG: 6,7-dimethyl-8-ribityllumazine synthase, partial [Bacteroidia bacterium]|nr:6,7-dimethyl-8-ribityllumazine synthase [Bacteroidia bacterium]